ncbi:hypothetical protein ACYOEI_16835, partial [Singulisphaera rosea]
AHYAESPSRPFRTASLDHIQCGHLDCAPDERVLGANLGLYSVTFNNDLAHDVATLERFHEFRAEAERKGFRYFLEVFDPNMPEAIPPDVLPGFINDMIARMLAGVAPAGRPVFLKMVYHGPRAMEELFRYDPHLVIGILGGSAGTTLDAFQLLFDAQKYGAKVALFGRKINGAENQLAFVQFLRLIVDGVIAPVDAVKAYHAVLGKLGIRPHRSLEVDLTNQVGSMSYGEKKVSVTVPPKPQAASPILAPAPAAAALDCQCHTNGAKVQEPARNGSAAAHDCGCHSNVAKPSVEPQRNGSIEKGFPIFSDGRPDFGKMDVGQRLAYHRQRLGLGR